MGYYHLGGAGHNFFFFVVNLKSLLLDMTTSYLCHVSTMSKKRGRGFGFGGFSLSNAFHKQGQLSSFQKKKESEGWGGSKHKSEEE